jgi:hypothetical protein
MERVGLRTGLGSLLRRSRQALNLYSDLSARNEVKEVRDLQVHEWKLVNAELVASLEKILDYPQNRLLAATFVLRDRFNQLWREREAELAVSQRSMISLLEAADFLKVHSLSGEASVLKARLQASQAACNEIDACLKVAGAQRPVFRLEDQDVLAEDDMISREESQSQVLDSRKVISFNGARLKRVASK